MTDLKTTLVDLKAALEVTLEAMESADADVKTAIESDQAFFAFVQKRNLALQSAISERVRRNRPGWLFQGTVSVLEHAEAELKDPLSIQQMSSEELRKDAKKLVRRANSLAGDTRGLMVKLNNP